jgi:membrane protein implicated in regulation of membrane protease activity
LFLFFHVSGILLPALFLYNVKPAQQDPFRGSEQVYLWIVGVGDILCGIMGFLGIWLSRNLVPLGWRQMAKLSSTWSMLGTGLVLVWRSLVLVTFAPWAGVWLAFDGHQEIKFLMYIFVVAYLVLSVILVFVLARAFRQTVSDALHLQEHTDSQHVQERGYLLHQAALARQQDFHADGAHGRDHEVEPEVFGVFPLAPAVTCYALVIGIALLLAFLFTLLTGRTVGGWAFFAEHPKVNTTFWLELFVDLISVGTAIAGVVGASVLAGIRLKRMSTTLDLAILCLQIFLIGSMFRYAMTFAVTGMAFLEKNTCGFYVHGLAQMAQYKPWSRGNEGWMHCELVEYFALLLALVICVVDGYLVWCTYKLWHFAQDWTVRDPEEEDAQYKKQYT